MELNKTIQFYFRQPALESVSLPELHKASQKYPYCVALQFLLLKKMQEEKVQASPVQFEKTTLFFTNPYLLKAQLSNSIMNRFIPILPARQSGEKEIAPELPVQSEPVQSVEPTGTIEQETHIAPKVEDAETTKPDAESYSIDEKPEEEESFPPVPEPALRSDLLRMESPIPIPSFRDLSPRTDDTPVFEPYHTIDYFASQGIKLSQEVPVNDRLGRQLKSFTEWIKTMKRLPQPKLEEQLMDAGNGEKIVAMAAGSVEPREVLTETMAEVLVKQGNIAKAVDLYRKLSLAHPDKSTYFATRIEQLKNR